jgi:hypothetical protein
MKKSQIYNFLNDSIIGGKCFRHKPPTLSYKNYDFFFEMEGYDYVDSDKITIQHHIYGVVLSYMFEEDYYYKICDLSYKYDMDDFSDIRLEIEKFFADYAKLAFLK